MKKDQTLYLECYSGISGDMTVAALLDLGADKEVLMRALQSLPLSGYEAVVSRVKKSGLDMCDFHVILDKDHENHDHDMEYLHGHSHGHSHIEGNGHGSAGEHAHEAGTGHGDAGEHAHEAGHSHGHPHRGLPEIIHIIKQGDLTERAERTAVKIFEILAEAEAKAHKVPTDQVHFHEVGAVDSIVDIVAAAVCLDDLNITEVIVPVLNEGRGTVRCQHGVLPVPVPAVMNIVQAHELPLHITETEGELVTPTGAAIAAAIRTSGRLPEKFTVRKTGMGAGKREYDRPSILRAMLIDAKREDAGRENAGREDDWKDDTEKDRICKLETNIDDCSGENLGYVMERLLEEGARDVHYTPAYMKKNRPAWQLNVICSEEDAGRLEQIIFQETTTIGIRRIPMERTILRRKIRTVQTPLGEAQVKVCRLRDTEQYFPEYDSVTALCRRHGKSYREAYRIVQRACMPPER